MFVEDLIQTLICAERIWMMNAGKSLVELIGVCDAVARATGLRNVMHARKFWSVIIAVVKVTFRPSVMREPMYSILMVNSKIPRVNSKIPRVNETKGLAP